MGLLPRVEACSLTETHHDDDWSVVVLSALLVVFPRIHFLSAGFCCGLVRNRSPAVVDLRPYDPNFGFGCCYHFDYENPDCVVDCSDDLRRLCLVAYLKFSDMVGTACVHDSDGVALADVFCATPLDSSRAQEMVFPRRFVDTIVRADGHYFRPVDVASAPLRGPDPTVIHHRDLWNDLWKPPRAIASHLSTMATTRSVASTSSHLLFRCVLTFRE